jgi:hypothetical protein
MAETAIAYADSGTGKTSIAIGLAKFYYEQFGLLTRVVTVEGVEPIENDGLIYHPKLNPDGIVQHFNVSARTNLLADMRKLSRGYWPKIVREEVPIKDELGNETGQTKLANVRRIVQDNALLDRVGLYFIETADGISDAFMRHIIKEETTGTDDRGKYKVNTIGPQGASGRYEEDGEVFGGSSQGHYNIVQVEMHNLFTAFGGMGGGVKLVFWTAHVGTGTDNDKNSVFCPMLVGQAKNAKVPSWVGECFHLENLPRIVDGDGNVIQEKKVRAFYENHREMGIMEGPQYLAKSRVGLSDIDALHERFPGGFIELGTGERDGLDQYYRWLKDRKGGNVEKMKKWKEGIDGQRIK